MACDKTEKTILQEVQTYYGKRVQQTSDLQTNACVMPPGSIPIHVRKAMKLVHEEVANKYYGCGLVVPECLEGMSILDLGSGAGHDCFILANLVGEDGHITGIDMTDEQLDVARKYIPYHAEKFGYKQPNIDFVKGYIEKLDDVGLKDKTFDIIVSNCVVNLSPNKRSVLKEAYRVLKDGGEFYFSDVYSDKVLPTDVKNHEILWGECIAGALSWSELVQLSREIGFATPRLVTAKTIPVEKPDLAKVVEGYKFLSVTYRLFKIPATEKYSKNVKSTYKGGITGFTDSLNFDHKYTFCKGEAVSVSSDVAHILSMSRLKNFFELKTSCCGQVLDDGPVVDPFTIATAGSSGCCDGGNQPTAAEDSSTGCCTGNGPKKMDTGCC